MHAATRFAVQPALHHARLCARLSAGSGVRLSPGKSTANAFSDSAAETTARTPGNALCKQSRSARPSRALHRSKALQPLRRTHEQRPPDTGLNQVDAGSKTSGIKRTGLVHGSGPDRPTRGVGNPNLSRAGPRCNPKPACPGERVGKRSQTGQHDLSLPGADANKHGVA